MTLAVVRNLASPRVLRSAVDGEDFEQEIVDQYALALAATGAGDATVEANCRAVVDFIRFGGRRLWQLGVEDADRYLVFLRRERHLRPSTVQGYAWAIMRFYDFAINRYQGDVHALTALATWAAEGHTTLRTITRETVAAAVTGSEHPSRTGQGLRSMFQLLKQDHVLFADPTYRMRIPHHLTREPLPVETAAIKALLDTSNPARAAVAALVAFHALHTGQVCDLKLVDVNAGWLHIDGRKIPLAEPVRERVTAYLDYRNTTWPRTANPHLFINRRSAMELPRVSHRWIKLLLGPGVSCRSIREDRILAEALASRGDARRLQDMFGLSIAASLRYTNVVDHPGFTEGA